MTSPKACPALDGEPPLWEREFPDFGSELGIKVPPGWEDVSYHNDVCPSFAYEVAGKGDEVYQYRLWVDYAAAGMRGLEGLRFRLSLHVADTGECLRDIHETESAVGMEALCALIALRDEVLDWQTVLGGERDGLDELCAFVDDITDPGSDLAEE